MQNFAAPFEPEALPDVKVLEYREDLMPTELLTELQDSDALVLTVTKKAEST
jgi:hypothetical protein